MGFPQKVMYPLLTLQVTLLTLLSPFAGPRVHVPFPVRCHGCHGVPAVAGQRPVPALPPQELDVLQGDALQRCLMEGPCSGPPEQAPYIRAGEPEPTGPRRGQVRGDCAESRPSPLIMAAILAAAYWGRRWGPLHQMHSLNERHLIVPPGIRW